MKDKKLTKPSLQNLLGSVRKLKPYLWLILLLFFALIYGFMLLKINGDLNAQPSSTQVSSDLKTTTHPAINQKVVDQLSKLQNNSVSVQTLFNQARQNPFQ